jgi:hypothetical protein
VRGFKRRWAVSLKLNIASCDGSAGLHQVTELAPPAAEVT